ncbi:hypothetical protein Y032_0255g312 [Ancylostoma ceylanicum]|uniref:Uncharacterized protein n=1 Tax=Ancylostoma ceylanicum TaxID=53326 RepID=A0A016SB59_9BILA|nr:hypothetical protein Y032_0255g312 [Ancylostoma ceylanicum]
MAVDYSSQDFRHSLAAIDAASCDGVISRDGVFLLNRSKLRVNGEDSLKLGGSSCCKLLGAKICRNITFHYLLRSSR